MQIKIVIAGTLPLLLASLAAGNLYSCKFASWKPTCDFDREVNKCNYDFIFESCTRLSLQAELLKDAQANITTNTFIIKVFNNTETSYLAKLIDNIFYCVKNGTKDVEYARTILNMKRLRQIMENKYCMWNIYKYISCLLFNSKFKSDIQTNRSCYQEEVTKNINSIRSSPQKTTVNSTDTIPMLENVHTSSESPILNVTDADRCLKDFYNFSAVNDDSFTRQVFPFIVLNIVFALISFVGNGTLVFLFLRHKELRTNSNIMILNMTVANIFCSIISTLFSIPSLWNTTWNWMFIAVLWDIVTGTCVYSMTLLSFQRYLAVTNTTAYNSIKPKKLGISRVFVVFAVWVLSFVVAIPTLLFKYFSKEMYLNLLAIIYFFLHFFIPAIILSVFTVATSRRLRRSILDMPGETLGQEVAKRSRAKTARVLVILCVCFITSYIPIFIVDIGRNVFHIIPTENYLYAAYISFSFSFINISFNPIALYLLSNTFRYYFAQNFLCCFDKIRLNCGCSSKLGKPSLHIDDSSTVLVV